jgi:hypothetical protein
MKPPIRKYIRATIYFREGGFAEGFEVCIYSGFVIYFDDKGHERTVNIHLINEVVNYKEEGGDEVK